MAHLDADPRRVAEATAVAYEPRGASGDAAACARSLQQIKSFAQSGETYFGSRPVPTREEVDAAVRDIQALVDKYVPEGVSLMDELNR